MPLDKISDLSNEKKYYTIPSITTSKDRPKENLHKKIIDSNVDQ